MQEKVFKNLPAKQLQNVRVAILVADDFEQVEMTEPRKALDEAGAMTTLLSPKPGQVTGMNHDVKSDAFKVDITLEQADPHAFDAGLLPGGVLDSRSFPVNPKEQKL